MNAVLDKIPRAAASIGCDVVSGDDLGTTGDLDAIRLPHLRIEVFRETDRFAEVWSRVAADRRMIGTTATLHDGGFPAAIRRYASEPTPNLIIVETDSPDDVLDYECDALAEVCDPSTQLVIVGHRNDIALYRRLIGIGVAGYLVHPVTVCSLIEAIGAIYAEPEKAKIGRIAAVVGASGGSGASSIAQNTALIVSEHLAADVLLVDMDLTFGTAALNLDIEANQGLAEVIDQAARLDAGMLDRVLIRRGLHLTVLTTSNGLDSDRRFDPFSVERLLDVASTHMPQTVLDVPFGWSDWHQRTFIGADDVLVVAEPELASLRNAGALMTRLRALRPNDAPPKLVLNKVGMPRRQEVSSRDVASILSHEPAASLPFDAKLFSRAAGSGKMAVEMSGNKALRRTLTRLADGFLPQRRTLRPAKRTRSFWRR